MGSSLFIVPSNRPYSEIHETTDRCLAVFLFVSGAVALVYEVAWQRQFALVLGSSSAATAAVLAAYFAGLGAGSLLVGRWTRRCRRPLRLYAIFEVLVGVGALLVGPLLAGLENAYANAAHVFDGNAVALGTARVAITFVALLVPTFCMGGTLPLLGQFVDRGQRRLGVTAGRLYAVNTLGAATGALLVPFWLLPAFGLRETVWLGAAANGLLAVTAWWLDHRQLAPSLDLQGQTDADRGTLPHAVKTTGPGGLALASGIGTFALQVLWNRAFAQIHENSMYSFAVIVTVVIFALAVGAQIARVSLRRGIAPRRLLGAGWMLAGLATGVSPFLFLRATNGLSYLSGGEHWLSHALQLAALAGAFVFPAMLFFGVGLPALMEEVGANGETTLAGTRLGRLLAANIVGSVVGALAAGFVLPQWLGLWGALGGVGGVFAVLGLRQWLRRSWIVDCALVFVAFGIAWLTVQSGLSRVKVSEDENLLTLREGTHGITAVVERPGSRRVKLNNHYGLGGTASTGDERMQAHIPLLLHAAPRRVAFLGLGTGISAGGALFHPVEQVTIAELVPEVITVSRQFFAKENEHVLDDPRTRIVADDARHFLRGTAERFDVIVGDLVVPWRAGEGSLFTVEQFALAKRALAPGGIFCQWLPLFQLSEPEMKILLRTFLSVFPRAEIWRGDFSPTQPAIALIGSAGEWRSDPQIVRPRLREMRPDAANPQLRAVGNFWMQWVGVIEASDLPADEVRINSEDRPWVELLGPKLHGAGQSTDALFIGRRLQAWLDDVQRRSASRMAEWPEPERASAAAGRVLAEFVLRLSEHDEAGAEAAQAELRRRLPDAEYRALFP